MMKPAVRNRLIIGAAIVAAAIFIAVQMYYSQTPARRGGKGPKHTIFIAYLP